MTLSVIENFKDIAFHCCHLDEFDLERGLEIIIIMQRTLIVCAIFSCSACFLLLDEVLTSLAVTVIVSDVMGGQKRK